MSENGARVSLEAGILPMPVAAGVSLHMVACADIAAFTRMAFDDVAGVRGAALELAGDDLTGERAGEILSSISDRPIRSRAEPMAGGFLFPAEHYRADVAALRRLRPQLASFADWASTAFGAG